MHIMDEIENYEVTNIIGSGSFGTCYKVKHKTSSKEYVWKAVNYGQMLEDKKQLLVSEVNLLSKLQHPHIVRYYDHIIHKKSSTLYIIMECCNGGDLSKIIKQCRKNTERFDEVFIWRVLYQIALALQICHSKCGVTVLHRDIKPANVFLDSDNNVKLGDFGLAKILQDKENFAETMVGTPLYMSPELIKNKRYNKKSDIWALGCLVYEISALKPPFTGSSLKSLSNNISEGKYNRIPQYYSDDLQKMINFLLNLESGDRPSVDVIIQHPTVLSRATQPTDVVVKQTRGPPPFATVLSGSALDQKCCESFQIKLDNLRNRETALKHREDLISEKEQALVRRERKVTLLERVANEKVARADLYLRQCKMAKTSARCKTHVSRRALHEDSDASFSADPGDNSVLPTSTKLNEGSVLKPLGFVRSKSERRVHFNPSRTFENDPGDLVLKEYNFFENPDKAKKKSAFSGGVLRMFNNKISQSSSSLGSKSSSNSDKARVEPARRPVSWTQENKKCAFSLLKIMTADSDKENICTQVVHTKM